MAQTFLIFDYGVNEARAQEARHKLEGWKQAFRLDKKLLIKFERSEAGKKDSADGKHAASAPKEKSKATEPVAAAERGSHIRLLVRLDFSDHEKLSYRRWLDRVPADEHFKNASPKIVRPGEAEFTKTTELFDSLD
jgi:hypothetical protein